MPSMIRLHIDLLLIRPQGEERQRRKSAIQPIVLHHRGSPAAPGQLPLFRPLIHHMCL